MPMPFARKTFALFLFHNLDKLLCNEYKFRIYYTEKLKNCRADHIVQSSVLRETQRTM